MRAVARHTTPEGELLAELARRLSARSPALRGAMFERACAIEAAAAAIEEIDYRAGLKASVAATIQQAIEGIQHGEQAAGPVPLQTLLQARRAARSAVALDTVLLRCTAAHTLLAGAILDEAQELDLGRAARHAALHVEQSLFERELEAVASEHRRESERLGRSDERHRSAVVRRLLAGAAVDGRGLQYAPDGWHLAVIAGGPGAREAVRSLARALNREVLVEERCQDHSWAWLGGERRVSSAEVLRSWPPKGAGEVTLAIGEPAHGVSGFRETHRQAQAAFEVARGRPQPVTLFRDVALLAAVLRDELLASSLERLYLEPLSGERDDGQVLRETLRAYLASGCSASSAAVVLGVNRHTVEARVRTAERRLGRPLPAWRTEMDVALRVAQLNVVG